MRNIVEDHLILPIKVFIGRIEDFFDEKNTRKLKSVKVEILSYFNHETRLLRLERFNKVVKFFSYQVLASSLVVLLIAIRILFSKERFVTYEMLIAILMAVILLETFLLAKKCNELYEEEEDSQRSSITKLRNYHLYLNNPYNRQYVKNVKNERNPTRLYHTLKEMESRSIFD
jgi:ABC-type lipoprotein release transport system permease subunit